MIIMMNHHYNPLLLFLLLLLFNVTVSVAGWTAEWIDLSSQPLSKINPPRSGHVSFIASNDLYVFGGYAEEQQEGESFPPNRYSTNDLWKWNTNNGGWDKILDHTTTNKPQPRLASTAAVLNQKQPFLFGGWDPSARDDDQYEEFLNDIIQFNTNNNNNKEETNNNNNILYDSTTQKNLQLDEPTSRHVAVTISNDIILLHTHRCNDYVWLFTMMDNNNDKPKLYKQSVTGDIPTSRGLHVACKLHNKNKLILFGGAAQDGIMSNEVYCLDLDHWYWTKVDIISTTTTQQPSPRAASCFCTIDDSNIILFGGAERTNDGGLNGCNDLWLLQFDTNDNDNDTTDYTKAKWISLDTDFKPPGRNAATLNQIHTLPRNVKVVQQSSDNDEVNYYFVLSGGWAPFQITYNENIILRLCNNNKKN